MGCGSSSPKPVANSKQSQPIEPSTEQSSSQSAQNVTAANKNTNNDNQSERQTSNSQVDIKIEASPPDGQNNTDQSNFIQSDRHDDLHLSGDSKQATTPTTRNEEIEDGDETKDLGDYSPRNQKIADRNARTASSVSHARYQRSAARPQEPNTTSQAPNTRSHAPNTRSHAPNTRKQVPNARSQAPNAKFPGPNTKSQSPGTRYQKNLNVPSTRAGPSSPGSGSRQNSPRNAVAPAQLQTQRGQQVDQQPDRKRILTETNERLIKREEGYPIQDDKRRRVIEDHSPHAKQRSKHENNRSRQHGRPGQPTESYQRGGQGTGAGNRPGHVGSSQDTDLGTFGELTFPDPGVDPAVYTPPPMVDDDRNATPESSVVISPEAIDSGRSVERVDASVQAQMSCGNDSAVLGSDEENRRQGSEHSSTGVNSRQFPRSAKTNLQEEQNAGSEVTGNISPYDGKGTECSTESTRNDARELMDNDSVKAEDASEQTHTDNNVPKSSSPTQSKPSSPLPNETESIRSESRTEESLKDVHIDATIQTLDTSYTPSVSVETQHTEPKRKRKKPLSSPRSDDPIERAKLRRIRLRLRDATLGTDIDELDEAIWLFETYELVDNGDLTNAVDRLDFLQLRQDLREALVRRNLGILRRVIEDSRASKHEQELGSLLTRAEELRDHLQALDSYSHDILSMDQKLISEIRSYCSPPPSVHEVMAACYMLLGVREERLLEWAEIQSQLGRLGRNGLRNMILNFDPDSVPLEMVLRIKEILNFYRLEDVRIASNGAASFYIWAKNMVDMIDRRRAQSNENDNKERVKSAEKQG